MTKPKFSYDEECEKLARYFLGDGSDIDIYTEDHVKALAQHIQTAIEDWITYQECGEGTPLLIASRAMEPHDASVGCGHRGRVILAE